MTKAQEIYKIKEERLEFGNQEHINKVKEFQEAKEEKAKLKKYRVTRRRSFTIEEHAFIMADSEENARDLAEDEGCEYDWIEDCEEEDFDTEVEKVELEND